SGALPDQPRLPPVTTRFPFRHYRRTGRGLRRRLTFRAYLSRAPWCLAVRIQTCRAGQRSHTERRRAACTRGRTASSKRRLVVELTNTKLPRGAARLALHVIRIPDLQDCPIHHRGGRCSAAVRTLLIFSRRAETKRHHADNGRGPLPSPQ